MDRYFPGSYDNPTKATVVNHIIGAYASGGGAEVHNSPTTIHANKTIHITLNLTINSVEAESAGFLSKLFKRVIRHEQTHSIECGLGENKSTDDVIEEIIQRIDDRRCGNGRLHPSLIGRLTNRKTINL